MNERSTDRRTLKTRKAICEAFAELLTKKELQKVTVREITEIANINRVTFYKHYLDIYDLYDKIEQEILVEIGLLALQLEDISNDEFYSHLINYFYENRVLFKMIFSPNATGQMRSKLEKLINGIFRQVMSENQNVPAKEKDMEYMSYIRANICLSIISKWILSGCEDPAELIIDTVSALDDNMVNFFEDSAKMYYKKRR
ncbi:MAG: TetR/AcrR family transcriptional regulator C-terminal domain-containing protein [Lachnospiraceae bacterium]|nr:TetR/AcrR family transcriptional regulator C-terminal domain-containing protein [Lachnospiraceae bacterium]